MKFPDDWRPPGTPRYRHALFDHLKREHATPDVDLAHLLAIPVPGPDLAMCHPEQEAAQVGGGAFGNGEKIAGAARRMLAAQALEDEAGRAGMRGGIAGLGLYHRYNAVLKRVTGGKSRAQMTLSELEAAIGWLERNRLAEHLSRLGGDPGYAWSARKRVSGSPRSGAQQVCRADLNMPPRRLRASGASRRQLRDHGCSDRLASEVDFRLSR